MAVNLTTKCNVLRVFEIFPVKKLRNEQSYTRLEQQRHIPITLTALTSARTPVVVNICCNFPFGHTAPPSSFFLVVVLECCALMKVRHATATRLWNQRWTVCIHRTNIAQERKIRKLYEIPRKRHSCDGWLLWQKDEKCLSQSYSSNVPS